MNLTVTVPKKRHRTAATRHPSTNSDKTVRDLSLNRNHHSLAIATTTTVDATALYFNDTRTAATAPHRPSRPSPSKASSLTFSHCHRDPPSLSTSCRDPVQPLQTLTLRFPSKSEPPIP
ncbi:hypothetical protein RIF29_29671 [Crotalaria pallida]|uniref:Uncharacterized protein n=1 Tax=Crotalaria pallida TaxID=3830 RepID=A0AAN9EEZ0_CROPI